MESSFRCDTPYEAFPVRQNLLKYYNETKDEVLIKVQFIFIRHQLLSYLIILNVILVVFKLKDHNYSKKRLIY